jgi:hypothetical protein
MTSASLTYSKLKYDGYPKEECHKDISCHLVPSLPNLWAKNTPSVLLLSKQLLHALKWLTTHCLHSVQYVHHVGFDIEVLGSPTSPKS